MAAVLIIAFVWIYADAIASLVKVWNGRDDYSHGFLVPLASLYFIWLRREKLKTLSPSPNMTGGLILMGTAALIMLLGTAGSITALQQVSIVVMIPGIVLLLLGVRYLKALALPLLYLVLMVPPILDAMFSRIHWPFQLFGATASALFLDLLHIPVFRQEQFLELPGITLEVARECSGVRYLVSIIALAVPLAFIMIKNNRKRILYILLALAVGILANPVRIALISIWMYLGYDGVHGPGHLFHGYFVSLVGYGFLFFGGVYFSRTSGCIENHSKSATSKSSMWQYFNFGRFRSASLAGLSVLVMLGSVSSFHTSVPVHMNTHLNEIPEKIANWEGRDVDEDLSVSPFEGADQSLHRVYRNTSGDEVTLYVGFFEQQNQQKKINTFKAAKLIGNSSPIQLSSALGGGITASVAQYRHDRRKVVSVYWYDVNGRIIANGYQASLLTAVNSLTRRRTNGAVVCISVIMRNGEETAKAQETAREFSEAVAARWRTFFPQEAT